MIELGTILGGAEGAVRDARRKVRVTVERLTADAMLASRIASVTSQLFRVADRGVEPGRIDVRLDEQGAAAMFVLDIVGVGKELDHAVAEPFFDHVARVRVDGEPSLRLGLYLDFAPGAEPSQRRIAEMRAVIEQKGRDALMQELTVKNRELQESFDNLRRTRTAKERKPWAHALWA